MSCPICCKVNKIRQDTKHIVCYKCHNSISISKDKSNSTNVLNNHQPFTNYYDEVDNTNVSFAYETYSIKLLIFYFLIHVFFRLLSS